MDTKSLFILEKIDVSPFVVEFGQRWDKVKYVVDTTNHISSRGQGGAYSKNRTFFVQNTHLGLLFQPVDTWYLKLQRSWQNGHPKLMNYMQIIIIMLYSLKKMVMVALKKSRVIIGNSPQVLTLSSLMLN